MPTRSVIIDGDGRLWPSDGKELRRYLGVGIQGEALIRFCVHMLGMVHVTEHSGVVTVMARPGNACKLARLIAADFAMRWTGGVIWAHAPGDVEKPGAEPICKILRSRHALGRWMAGPANLDFPAEVTSTEIDLSFIEDLPVVLRLASGLTGFSNPVQAICEAEAQAWKFSLVALDYDDKLVMENLGPGFRPQHDAIIRDCIGRALQHDGNAGYGAWAVDAMWRALKRKQAVVEHVDAKVDWPAVGLWHHVYTSVRMPVRDRDGKQLLLSATRNLDCKSLEPA